MVAEKCLNCGCGIGDLETPYIWNGRVVCRSCYATLQPKSGVRKWMVLVVACLGLVGIAVGGTIWLSSLKHEPPASTPLVASPANPSSVRVAAPTPAVNAPPPMSRVGAISGSVWLSRNNGSSDIQRGLAISVIRGTVGQPLLARCLQKELVALQKSETNFTSIGSESALKEANEMRGKIVDAQRTVGQLSAQTGVLEAQSLLKNYAPFGRYGVSLFSAEVVPANTVKQVRTGADGKYTIDGLAEGDYFLHAFINTDVIFVEWIAPVHVTAGTTASVDMFNDNAAVIY